MMLSENLLLNGRPSPYSAVSVPVSVYNPASYGGNWAKHQQFGSVGFKVDTARQGKAGQEKRIPGSQPDDGQPATVQPEDV